MRQLFQLKRGLVIGENARTEEDFAKTINLLKNEAGCVEVSRTGQASDRSLTVELKYRDFPSFSVKMSEYSSKKGRIVKFGDNLNADFDFFSNSQKVCDLVLSEKYMILLYGSYIWGIVKDNFGTAFAIVDYDSLATSEGGKAGNSRDIMFLPKKISANSKVLMMDVFCPDFSRTADSSTLDFERKLDGIKTVAGLKEIPDLTRFSVDGQEYMKLASYYCAEVTP